MIKFRGKLLVFILIMVSFILVSCSGKTYSVDSSDSLGNVEVGNVEPGNVEPGNVEVGNVEAESIESIDNQGNSTESTLSIKEKYSRFNIENENDRLAAIIDANRTDEEVEGFPVYTDNTNGALDFLMISEDILEEYAISFSLMGVEAYSVAILKPIEGSEDIVFKALENFRISKIDDFKNYMIEQVEQAESAITFSCGDYVGIVMSYNSEEMHNLIINDLEHIEEIDIGNSAS